MAIAHTSELQAKYHREKIVATDQYGATSHLYIHASQADRRTELIAAHIARAQANEDAMTKLTGIVQGAMAPAPAATGPAPPTAPTATTPNIPAPAPAVASIATAPATPKAFPGY